MSRAATQEPAPSQRPSPEPASPKTHVKAGYSLRGKSAVADHPRTPDDEDVLTQPRSATDEDAADAPDASSEAPNEVCSFTSYCYIILMVCCFRVRATKV
jgi:hypothetical protein